MEHLTGYNRHGTANSTIALGDQRDFISELPTARVIPGTGAWLRPHLVLATGLLGLFLFWALLFSFQACCPKFRISVRLQMCLGSLARDRFLKITEVLA
jgi:hypothetical protein